MSSPAARPVVVGYDGSDLAQKAVEYAAQIAEHQGEPLVVLHAADRIRYVQDAGYGLWTPAEAHKGALVVAERGAQVARHAAPTVEVTSKSSLSSPAAALEEISLTARMIVVGNSGRGRVSGILLGSTAYHVATLARCPVTIVPPGALPVPGPQHKVSVATDGSSSAARAVHHATDVARRYGAPLEVITVWEKPYQDNRGTPPQGYASMSQAVKLRTEAAQKVAAEATEEILREEPGLTVTDVVVEGRPEEVIAEAAADSAALIVGARGRGDLTSLLLGSTSRAVLHHAKCPVQIIR
ncbi:universal stress protein [Ornithinimicrobium cavernae]|uniref:universal stress protein n=1 Tax=Ornithinimicrobium cavernae TaxID=2666047 RepID=UPI000D6927C3|nr:universal stress protein [Ornithinimicrobium cavernae]